MTPERAICVLAEVDDYICGVSQSSASRVLFGGAHRFVVAAALVGAATGFAVAGFERLTLSVVFDRVVADLPIVVLAFVPGLGLALATVWLRRVAGGLSPSTADEYLDSFHDGRQLSLRDLVHRLVAAVVTLGSGSRSGSKDRRSTWAALSEAQLRGGGDVSLSTQTATFFWWQERPLASPQSSRLRRLVRYLRSRSRTTMTSRVGCCCLRWSGPPRAM